jgi:hypothetical protein
VITDRTLAERRAWARLQKTRVEQVVVAEACTTPRAGGENPALLVRGRQRGVRLPGAQCSPARRTGNRARHTAHYHVQIRGDEGGKGELPPTCCLGHQQALGSSRLMSRVSYWAGRLLPDKAMVLIEWTSLQRCSARLQLHRRDVCLGDMGDSAARFKGNRLHQTHVSSVHLISA